jgi:hypothetical protein
MLWSTKAWHPAGSPATFFPNGLSKVILMAAEQFANSAQSTLSNAISSAASSLQVDNAAAFPTQGNFRILIDSELLLVTAVSGNTFTVTRAVESVAGVQLAAAHGAGATVTHVLTAASLQLACPSDMLASLVNNPNNLSNPSVSTLLASTWNVITASAACSAKLPPPAAGKLVGVRIAPASTNLFTLNPNGSETIDGASSRILWAAESAILISEGTNWYKVAGKSIPMLATMRLTASTTGGQFANGTGVKVLVNSADADNTGLMADTTNYQIVVKRSSQYQISGVVIWNGLSASSSRCITGLNKNGVGLVNGEGYGASGGFPSPAALVIATLASGDLLTLNGYQQSGASQDVFGAVLGVGSACQISVAEITQW